VKYREREEGVDTISPSWRVVFLYATVAISQQKERNLRTGRIIGVDPMISLRAAG
jgi:hypothetical protein